MGRGGGAPPRGGFGGRGRGGNFGIWQENVRVVHPPEIKEEEDRVVARFNAKKDSSPKLPLRMSLRSYFNAPSNRFILKVLGGERWVNLA